MPLHLSTKAPKSVSATSESVTRLTLTISIMARRDLMKVAKIQARWKKFSDRRSRRQTRRSVHTLRSSLRCHRGSNRSSTVKARMLQDRSCARLKESIQAVLYSLRGWISTIKLRAAAMAWSKLTRSKSKKGRSSLLVRGYTILMTRPSRSSRDRSPTRRQGRQGALQTAKSLKAMASRHKQSITPQRVLTRR